ncbi:MAG: hypothetical protein NTZ09_07910 [Candidatus Hydrogenedentes bacterium]|nr:hypothetical protein [Candidatus Hydrogenedentota bacterium]
MGSDILLLVSDCDEDAVALQAAAEDTCNLLVAANAAQCLQLISQSPQMILVSDRVSDSPGGVAAVCAEIRKDHVGACTPLIILADQDVSPDATDTDGVIRRPIDPAVLSAWLQATQRLAQLRRNLATDTEKQDLQQLLQSFARLSHAVNNPLQALYATVDMLLLNHGLSQEAAALASEIITHAGRVAKLVAEASGKAKLALQSLATERPTQVS